MRTPIGITIVSLLPVALAGCAESGLFSGQDSQRRMVELLMPQRLGIVEAFTGFGSFDDDRVPEGIKLLLAPVDSFGDPVKIAGTIRVELFSRLPASGNRRGERVCPPWQVPLGTPDDQKRYWNKVTGMYEIRLALPPDLAPTTDKYVLSVTYTTPLGEHLIEECEIEVPGVLRSLRSTG